MRRLIAATLLLPLFAAPAMAEVVTLKDGTQLHGALSVTAESLMLRADGKEQPVPYASVAAVSLDDKPVYAAPSPWEGHEWLAWSAIGADVVAIALLAYEAMH